MKTLEERFWEKVKQRTITLGIFSSLEDAAHARRVAEMSLAERTAA